MGVARISFGFPSGLAANLEVSLLAAGSEALWLAPERAAGRADCRLEEPSIGEAGRAASLR